MAEMKAACHFPLPPAHFGPLVHIIQGTVTPLPLLMSHVTFFFFPFT